MKSKLIPLVGILMIAAAVGLGAVTVARGQGWNAAGMMGGFYPAGMLSVNGSGGQVWFHTWHGRFIQGRDLGA
jgi:hypothetical protein